MYEPSPDETNLSGRRKPPGEAGRTFLILGSVSAGLLLASLVIAVILDPFLGALMTWLGVLLGLVVLGAGLLVSALRSYTGRQRRLLRVGMVLASCAPVFVAVLFFLR
jgi:hypothetical protein